MARKLGLGGRPSTSKGGKAGVSREHRQLVWTSEQSVQAGRQAAVGPPGWTAEGPESRLREGMLGDTEPPKAREWGRWKQAGERRQTGQGAGRQQPLLGMSLGQMTSSFHMAATGPHEEEGEWGGEGGPRGEAIPEAPQLWASGWGLLHCTAEEGGGLALRGAGRTQAQKQPSHRQRAEEGRDGGRLRETC